MAQSFTPAMSVTIVSTSKLVSMLPSVTASVTPPMGIGVEGSDRTLELRPE
jgi:hypothetical protein